VAKEIPRLRPDIEKIPEYKAGARPVPQPGIQTFKVSSNESHHDPLPSVVAAIEKSIADINRYPDPFSTDLVAAISQHFDVPVEHISLATGSVALCGQIIQSAAGPGDEVVYAWRSFEAYPIWTQIAGATSVKIPLASDETHDLVAFRAAITDRTRVIFLCTPNNPTGQIIPAAEIEDFIESVSPEIIIVLDEAYIEYVPKELRPKSFDLYRKYPNVVVLRTFSKAYGLAGLRVGFAVAQNRISGALHKTALPFGVSTLAQSAAIAALSAESELLDRVDHVSAERTRVVEALKLQGWELEPSYANFVWLRTGERTAEIHQNFERAGLSVRPFPGEGVRITVAEPDANDRVIQVLAQLI
jgi:histidinol-phosphate aminotransferase